MSPSFQALHAILDNWNTRLADARVAIDEKLHALDAGEIVSISDDELINLAQLELVCDTIDNLIDTHEDGATFDEVIDEMNWDLGAPW